MPQALGPDLRVMLVDADGAALSVGGGTQYAEGATAATATGNLMMWKDAANTLVAVAKAKPAPVQLGDATDYFGTSTFADVNATLATAVTKNLRVSADMLVADAGGNAMNRVRSVKDAIAGVGGGAIPAAGMVGLTGSTFLPVLVSSTGNPLVAGSVAHDGVDAGNPVKIGGKALAHGSAPTQVAAGDRVDLTLSRQGLMWSLGGHPNTQTVRANYTTAQTDTALVTVASGTCLVVTRLSFACSKANTVNVSAIGGFGATNTPSGAGVLLAHPNIDPGGGITVGNGGGILGIGGDNEDLRVTTGVATGGSIDVCASYYTIPV